VLLLALTSMSLAATQRFALLAGSNDGGLDRTTLSYAVDDAQALADVLTELGGFQPEHTLVLAEPDRAELETGVQQLLSMVEEAQARGDRTEVLVYYSGHSDERGLLPSGQRLGYGELRAELDGIPSDVRILVLDSCASGAMVRDKGGVHRAPFLLDESVEVSGYAYLTSASATEVAQEGDRIGGSYFTHALVTGLRGGADRSGDGRVTLNEAYDFAYSETLQTTERTLGGAQHANYDIRLAGSGDLVLTDLAEVSASMRADSELEGRLFVRDAEGRLVAELYKPSGQPLELGLAPGSYSVLLELDGGLYEARLELVEGQRSELSGASFVSIQGEATVSRGSSNRQTVRVPFTVGLMPSLVLGGDRSDEHEIHHLDVGFVATSADELQGLQTSIGANISQGEVLGWQSAVGGNVALGGVRGMQTSVGVNLAGQDVTGLQAAVMSNLVQGRSTGLQAAVLANAAQQHRGLQAAAGVNVVKDLRGLQGAAGANLASDGVRGGQLAAGLNVSRETRGFQLAAGLNVSQRVRGAQLAVLNVAGEVDGAQVGVINVARDADVSVGLISINGAGYNHLYGGVNANDLSAGLTYGGKRLYSAFEYNYRVCLEGCPGGDHTLLLGLGWHADPQRDGSGLYVDADLMSGALKTTFVDGDSDLVVRGRVVVGYALRPHLAIYAGPSVQTRVVDFVDGGDDLPVGWSLGTGLPTAVGVSAGVRF
jgi:hypothetical protein